jgi:hypothetical protein
LKIPNLVWQLTVNVKDVIKEAIVFPKRASVGCEEK